MVNEGEDERILCPEERALSVVVAMAPLDIRSKPEEDAFCVLCWLEKEL